MNTFWRGKKVLITGADGFIGSHLTERLAKEGARVRAFIYYNSFGRWGWLDEAEPALIRDIEIFPGDIRDPKRVEEGVAGTEFVFHLASLIAIPYSYHAPDSYVQTNVGGTLNMLNACRGAGIKRLMHTSTSEVYGTARYVPIDEKHPLQGQSPYSATKIGADMLAESFHRSFDLPITIIRPFNTFGPRQSARAVIPTILSQIYEGNRQIKLGALHPTRDFNFVADTVSSFLALAETNAAIGRVVNVGSGREISIGELASMVMRITGKEAEILCDEERLRPEKSEVDRLVCDASLARELTGWQPKHTLEQGLKITAQWVEQHLHTYRSKDYNI
jgi:NAD dependent epimerase/dehydratase